ncbi:MAG: cation transporting ATPase C-terminal domain-containing protein, partial [Clostridiales bacterium]|nr:cation transporting ATPase C-terminal domain-containing protein [Clostridiales bacterium]
LYSIIISIVAILFVTQTPVINSFLGYSSISMNSWLTIGLSGLIFLAAHETLKYFKRKQLK